MRRFLCTLALGAGLLSSSCAHLGVDEVASMSLGPAETPPTHVYRFAKVYDIVLLRLAVAESSVITPRVRLANQNAYDAVKDAYAAVSLSNAPPDLNQLVNKGASAVGLLAATAKLTGLIQDFPSITDPISVGGFFLGRIVNGKPIVEMYREKIDSLNSELVDMALSKTDPTQQQWDVLWASIDRGNKRLESR